MNKTKPPQLFQRIFLVLLGIYLPIGAYLLVDSWRLQTRWAQEQKTESAASASRRVASQTPVASQEVKRVILNRNIFNSPPAAVHPVNAPATPQKAEPAPVKVSQAKSGFKMKLVGVAYGSPRLARAVIETGGRQEVYRLHQRIKSARITKIERRRIVLEAEDRKSLVLALNDTLQIDAPAAAGGDLAGLSQKDKGFTDPLMRKVAQSEEKVTQALKSMGDMVSPERLARKYLSGESYNRDGWLTRGFGDWEANRRLRETKSRQATIYPGSNLKEIARSLESQGIVADRDAFYKMVTEDELPQALGLPGPTLEGYLFPGKYYFPERTAAWEVARTMVDRLWTAYEPDYHKRAQAMGLSTHEVLTLASIIERETRASEERPLIAAVLHNRLRLGMKLQCDPTVIYGLPYFDGRLNKSELLWPSPYNTYVHRGLPPGPISNPGLDTILAILYPAEVDYLYFVSRNNGTHQFSVTLREHNEAVARYQLRRGWSADNKTAKD